MSWTLRDLDNTGYRNGQRFESPQQVADYFTVENMAAMFGPEDGPGLNAVQLWEMGRRIIAWGDHLSDEGARCESMTAWLTAYDNYTADRLADIAQAAQEVTA